ncbi:MAG: M56 family metallopeptidase, partial [Planctomycetota bacterium]
MVDIALAWSLTYLLHSTILSLLALAIAARLQHPSRRTTVLRAGLFGAVATSTIAVALPGGDPALAWTPPAVATIADPAAAARGGPLGIEGGVGGAALAAEPGAPLDPLTLTLVLALLGSFAGAGAVVVRRRRWIESLQREPVPDGTDRALLVDLVGRRDVLLTRSSALEGPVALSDREVCVPSNAWQALPPAERRSLLAHEAAHLVRRDPSMLLAGHLLQHAAFFQPLHRLVRARAQVAAELAADVWAVDRTDDALGYARALHGFAARLSGPRGTPAFIPGALASRPPLTERVALALDGSARGPGRRERWGTGGAIGALLLGLACAGPRVDAADQARGAGDAPGRHALPGTMAGDELVVAIDGESGATLYEDAGARAVGTFQLTDRFGRAGLQEALKEASGPPQITSASPRYGGLALSDRTLRIRAGEDVLFRDVQYVMEQCGVQSLCLWDLELEVPQ